jgi:hypothetical protein
METMERTYSSEYDDPVAANFYPMVHRAFIKGEMNRNGGGVGTASSAADAESGTAFRASEAPIVQLTLLSDRAHGVSSLAEGEIEVMLHRRCIVDDNKGVGEVLNEVDHIRPKMQLLLDTPTASAALHRRLSALQNSPPQPLFGVF